jgi:hypothetical protein
LRKPFLLIGGGDENESANEADQVSCGGPLLLFTAPSVLAAPSPGLQTPLDFAAAGKVKATFAKAKFEDMNDTLDQMHKRPIEGPIMLDLAA